MATKRDKILNYPSDTAAAVIADELDTSENYVHKVRSKARAAGESGPSNEPDERPLAELDGESGESGPSEAGESPLEDLVIEDSHDEYECGECGATVEYLQDTCTECETELAWWAE